MNATTRPQAQEQPHPGLRRSFYVPVPLTPNENLYFSVEVFRVYHLYLAHCAAHQEEPEPLLTWLNLQTDDDAPSLRN
jgi:hypothetical protein